MHRILAFGILAATAAATTLPADTTRDLVRTSERICCVRCESCEARVDPRSGIVFTHTRFRLMEHLKGDGAGDVVELRLPGGRVGNRETRVPGMPTFKPGRESIVFLGPRNELGHPVLMLASRGVVSLRREEDGTRVLASPVNGFADLAGHSRIALDEFRRVVRAEVRAQAEEQARARADAESAGR